MGRSRGAKPKAATTTTTTTTKPVPATLKRGRRRSVPKLAVWFGVAAAVAAAGLSGLLQVVRRRQDRTKTTTGHSPKAAPPTAPVLKQNTRSTRHATAPYAVSRSVSLSDDECDALISNALSNHVLHEAASSTGLGTSRRLDTDQRVSEAWWLCSPTTDAPCEASALYGALANKILGAVREENEALWGVTLPENDARVDLKVLRYGRGGHFEWHVDAGPAAVGTTQVPRTRIATVTTQLSDPASYAGGDLQIGQVNVTRNRGAVLVYLSAYPHRVHAISRGRRYALIAHVWRPYAFSDRTLDAYRIAHAEPRLRALATTTHDDARDDDARDDDDDSKKQQKDRAAWALLWAEYLFASGDPRAALEPYQRAIGLDPLNARAWHRRGLALGHLDDGSGDGKVLKEAVAHFARADALKPNDAGQLADFVNGLIGLGKFDDAGKKTRHLLGLEKDVVTDDVLQNLALNWRAVAAALRSPQYSHRLKDATLAERWAGIVDAEATARRRQTPSSSSS